MQDKDELFKELQTILKPIVEWIKKNGTPYTTIVVNSSQARVVEDVVGIPAESMCDTDE